MTRGSSPSSLRAWNIAPPWLSWTRGTGTRNIPRLTHACREHHQEEYFAVIRKVIRVSTEMSPLSCSKRSLSLARINPGVTNDGNPREKFERDWSGEDYCSSLTRRIMLRTYTQSQGTSSHLVQLTHPMIWKMFSSLTTLFSIWMSSEGTVCTHQQKIGQDRVLKAGVDESVDGRNGAWRDSWLVLSANCLGDIFTVKVVK